MSLFSEHCEAISIFDNWSEGFGFVFGTLHIGCHVENELKKDQSSVGRANYESKSESQEKVCL